MILVEQCGFYADAGILQIIRVWRCCGHEWRDIFYPSDLDRAAWSPICPDCGSFDESFFV